MEPENRKMETFSTVFLRDRSPAQILRIMMAAPDDAFFGFELQKRLGTRAGAIYKLLHRMETVGVLRSELEEGDIGSLRRAPRRLYWLTPAGKQIAQVRLRQLGIRVGKL